ncbi:anti-sigma factor family protein [Psychromicrobium lacuslunae]|uniref:Putative zinc-finger domain-containing protein n=1 Tax=Psychromicrobium lacuslunae TaxID=1618207 RepID=A0A0D4BXK3_9MICC|nr:zf-HC2 domain-containing protein [Psychromicrobium lacuslunae]AJT41043.1 hypothetical protein UM93_05060 [Psychromicrobium lacuslunae]
MSRFSSKSQHDDSFNDWDAAYVLGSLSPKERHQYEEHLARCALCREAVSQLAGIPGILGTVPAEQAIQVLTQDAIPPAATQTLPELASRVRRGRLRRRVLIATAGLAVAACAVGTTAVLLPRESHSQIQQALAIPLNFASVSAANFTVTGKALSMGWGTQLEWVCEHSEKTTNTPPNALNYDSSVPSPYQLVVTDKSGKETVAASWQATDQSEIFPVTTIALPITQIAKIEVRLSSTGQVAARANL